MTQPALHLSLNQQLQITPKLQQAIRMLQLSTQELTQELHQLLQSNVMLELDSQATDIAIPTSTLSDDDNPEEFGWDPVDAPQPATAVTDLPWQDKQHQSDYNLHEYLLWQLRSSPLSAMDYTIGESIIYAIDDQGLLQESLHEIQEDLTATGHCCHLTQIESVLKKIQGFDPLGVGAKDVQECLLLQLAALPANQPGADLAKTLIQHHMAAVAAHNYTKLQRLYQIKKNELHQALELIHHLNPRPGNAPLLKGDSAYISPDLLAVKKHQRWQAKLNPILLPKLRLNEAYLGYLDKNPPAQESHFIHHHLREAKWLMQCVQQRNDTLLKVANCILKHQQGFMEHGPGAMQSLILKDIADELHLHQSTISRVSSKKYIQTPRGTFELKYFFGSHIDSEYGQPCSALAIKTFLKEMIQQENPLYPLSDHHLAKQFAKKGLQVARRTISKYRELLHIPAAAKRKRLKWSQ